MSVVVRKYILHILYVYYLVQNVRAIWLNVPLLCPWLSYIKQCIAVYIILGLDIYTRVYYKLSVAQSKK